MQSDMPRPSKNLACRLFTRLLEPVIGQQPEGGPPTGPPDLPVKLSDVDPDARTIPREYAGDGPTTLGTLIGGPA
jgi:hypothetical protein